MDRPHVTITGPQIRTVATNFPIAVSCRLHTDQPLMLGPRLASKTSEDFLQLLRNYHRITTKRGEVKALLSREHGIDVRYEPLSFTLQVSIQFQI
jgi:hypothetical protein